MTTTTTVAAAFDAWRDADAVAEAAREAFRRALISAVDAGVTYHTLSRDLNVPEWRIAYELREARKR
jgi:hypothetical protein